MSTSRRPESHGGRLFLDQESPALGALLVDRAKKPEPARYEIVFAVITSARKEDWPRALPFFSQLNFVRSAQRLAMFGFRVSLCRIGEKK
jgi:uncharacterized protein (TIGR04141 family)